MERGGVGGGEGAGEALEVGRGGVGLKWTIAAVYKNFPFQKRFDIPKRAI